MANKWAINQITQNLLIFNPKINIKQLMVIVNAILKNNNKIFFLFVTHTGIIKINKIIIVIGQIIT